MIWTNEDKLIVYVGQRIMLETFPILLPTTTIPSPLTDVVGLTCGTTDSSRLFFIQGKDMKVRELIKAKYHKNSKHITVETTSQIYTTDKKTLLDYYKKQFHKGIQYIESLIDILEHEVNTAVNNKTNTKMYVPRVLENIQAYRELKVKAMNVYRQTLETIKKL